MPAGRIKPVSPYITAMADDDTLLKPAAKAKATRPPLYKVILLNDDFTPRDFVTRVLKSVFRMGESDALGVMLTAHRLGASVVAVFTREVAEDKAAQANEMGAAEGYPLTFTTEKE
ncbi:ATP-dependent Clp protease adaptor ClpS [Palleronia rufa]|uniref:ATP-dependent Clp protease adaptor ClpS n=2 Tax=Palleronia rufa TaxID=1530186 RepID=UPI000AE6AFF0|nr:ATP-dependent Clp protease adaptor ClpS [Palleronia rufa]